MTADEPKFSISQITTLPASFAEDVAAYRDAGADGIGIWEMRLPKGADEEALERLEASGLVSTNAVPQVPSILPLPLFAGPETVDARVDALCRSLHRLAPFRPTSVVCLTGPAGDLARERARALVVEALRTLAHEARGLGIRIGLEPYSRYGGEDWTIINTIGDAARLVDEADVEDAVGILFDVWHLWDQDGLEAEIAQHGERFVGVHVNDWRDPTRGFADRVLPGEGIADVPSILGALDRAGWAGFYDLEIFSDNGTFGEAYPDSLWDVPASELARRGREAFLACWARRS